MKFSNFRNYSFHPEFEGAKHSGIRKATVDVTTRPFPWFKEVTVAKDVFSISESIYWRFADTGEFTPGHQVENLHCAYTARNL